MKHAYLGIKFHPDQRNRALIETHTAVLTRAGFTTTCIARDLEQWGTHTFAPQVLMRRTLEIIRASDLAIIDLSEKGVGLGIEAGYAFAHTVPLVVVAPTGCDISETLHGIATAVVAYDTPADLLPFWRSWSDTPVNP